MANLQSLIEAQPQKGLGYGSSERHSHSTHQAAEPSVGSFQHPMSISK
jgi:hypothetical protein